MELDEETKKPFLPGNNAWQVDLETFVEWDFVILFWGPGNLYKIWEVLAHCCRRD